MVEGVILKGDIEQIFKNCIIMPDNKPLFVKTILSVKEVEVHDLLTQRSSIIPFDLEKFLKPIRRLGMVNIEGETYYLVRKPVRKMMSGLHINNIEIQNIPSPWCRGKNKNKLDELRCIEIADCIMDYYPSYEDAIALAQKIGGCYAFDKQFALDTDGKVFYKKYHVGTANFGKNNRKIENIVWKDGCEHLISLLNGNYEKTFSIVE